VLKPNDDYGGRGIVLGWLASAEEWERTLRGALEAPYVVQERIPLPSEPFPTWTDGGVQIYDRMVDLAPFITGGATVDGGPHPHRHRPAPQRHRRRRLQRGDDAGGGAVRARWPVSFCIRSQPSRNRATHEGAHR
jgi:hypothetical protein